MNCCGLKVEKGLRKCYNPFQHLDTLYIAVDTKEILLNGAIYNSFHIKDVDKDGIIYIDVGKGKLLQCKIPNVSENGPGLMTALQKKQLEFLYDLLNEGTAKVAITGDYNDLKNTPTVLSQFFNDSGFVNADEVSQMIEDNEHYQELLQKFESLKETLYGTGEGSIDYIVNNKIKWVEH